MITQVLSRNNDRNGNGFRLLVAYQTDGMPVCALLARDSMPSWPAPYNIQSRIRGYHLTPAEFNAEVRSLRNLGILREV